MEGLYIQMKPGVLEHGTRAYRVDHLEFQGRRIGYVRELRELEPPRWRWLLFDPRGDYVGDEPTQYWAARIAQYCHARREQDQRQAAAR